MDIGGCTFGTGTTSADFQIEHVQFVSTLSKKIARLVAFDSDDSTVLLVLTGLHAGF